MGVEGHGRRGVSVLDGGKCWKVFHVGRAFFGGPKFLQFLLGS